MATLGSVIGWTGLLACLPSLLEGTGHVFLIVEKLLGLTCLTSAISRSIRVPETGCSGLWGQAGVSLRSQPLLPKTLRVGMMSRRG